MSPRTEEQYEKIRLEKRQLIMDTALELFAANGFENTSISQIAKRANISKGLLYNYFESKDELLETILHIGIDEMYDILDPNKDGILEIHEMKFFITETFQIIKKNPKFWKLYWAISFQPLAINVFQKKGEEHFKSLGNMMIEYFKNQGFEKPEIEILIFSALMKGLAISYTMTPELLNIEETLQEVINRYCKI